MSEDEELRKLREQRMIEMQQQQAQQAQQSQAAAQQNAMLQAQKQAILGKILSSEARARLANIRLARSDFAENLELQLIQAYQSGALGNQIPLPDEKLKALLIQLQQSQKRERKIKFK
ncbi:DNA-binding protein [Candidatus Lokiarchaeum ossiferum]|uniref:DNA-binding protein n=1 Tax=Candidatus Lokiarchaeum ossiferum TaxID=2951803 RepID=A0ABY6HMZ1_9ARCH|nr:DNA-binding protein [Candidatus Lokiarchaeum sp. B-35]